MKNSTNQGTMLPHHSETPDIELRRLLVEIIETRQLVANFQPIIWLSTGKIIGYEGLIRGPSDSPLHSPTSLFKSGEKFELIQDLELLCRQVTLEAFVRQNLIGKLFLNVSPERLLDSNFRNGETLGYMRDIGLQPAQVVIELTENQRTLSYSVLCEATDYYRSLGFEIAIDDLGEGFSSLRLWSELRPEYIKLDQHFIQNIHHDPIKLQFVRSIQQIAINTDTRIIAEGIETHEEYMIVKDIGITLGQGYYIARPNPRPITTPFVESPIHLDTSHTPIYPVQSTSVRKAATASKLLIHVIALSQKADNEQLYSRFAHDPELEAIPIVNEENIPIGLVNRHFFLNNFTQPFRRELYGKKACTRFMDTAPLIVDKHTTLQALSNAVVAAGRKHLLNGFIITDEGKYLGIGTGHDLMREITQMQIMAARYSNPLTLLPGNVPIDEHIDRLLENRIAFCACYCDLDAFKPYNDIYGYHKGDEIIRMTGKLLQGICNPDRDFVGHIGGDDFILLFQSPDWQQRCLHALTRFESSIVKFFDAEHHAQGGYFSTDRKGQTVFHALVTLSIGAVWVEPDRFFSHHDISSAVGIAKKQAKCMPGNSLFIEQRQRPVLKQ